MLKYVEKRMEWEDFIRFDSSCSCGCDSRLSFIFEDGLVSINMNTTDHCYSNNIFVNIWWRIKESFKVLFFGKISRSGEIIIKDKQHFEDIMEAMIYCKNKIDCYGERG